MRRCATNACAFVNKQGNPPALPGDSLWFDRVKRSQGSFCLDQEIGVPDERLPEPHAHDVGLQIPRRIYSQASEESYFWCDSATPWASATRAGTAERVQDRGGALDERARSHVHQHSTEAFGVVRGGVHQRQERDFNRAALYG